MSDKPRRDITLGEMQDECKRIGVKHQICTCECKYHEFCPVHHNKDFEHVDLTDPPRFNEKQTALLKALYGLDFISIENIGSGAFKTESKDGSTGLFMKLIGIEDGETLDLADMFGKDAT